jgi:valyl-tRNA synthetase
MVIPPPNVTGKLHLGHAWNTTLQDIIARYKRMCGYDVLWLPGMDHAGIATQAKVEEKLRKSGISRYDLGREKFLKEAWKWKEEYAKSIHEQWSKLGLSLDYSRERFTLDDELNKAVNKVFVTLYNKGLIYQGERIINWDPELRTALSNIEVIHQDDKGKFHYFKYMIKDSDKFIIVATTRPETMFGDVAIFVNPKDKRYSNLLGKMVINPANNEELPIMSDHYVDISFGTGAMKCTPAHDPNDFALSNKYHLPRPIIMNEDATMNKKCGKYSGLDRYECRDQLVKEIASKGLLLKTEDIVHQVGHSERSGAVVEPYLSKQWFVKMKPLAEQALANQASKDKVNFIPHRFEKIYRNWMENVDDWCISRQLWWGHRIPCYYRKKDHKILVSEVPPKDIDNYVQDEDVLDTWFSSALWPFATLGWPEKTEDLSRYYPISIMVTAYDIIFFWVSRMMFQGLEFMHEKPFDDCLIHGLIRDEQGRKMSKSLGNGIDPIDVINQYGIDALRYFLVTNSTPGQDLRYSDEKVAASANYLNKIWNSARYVLLTLGDDFKVQDIDFKVLSAPEKDILVKLNAAIKNIQKNMDKFEFGMASQYLYNFVYNDFCGNYLEVSKVSLQGDNITKQNETKQVLLYVLKNIILLIYPFTPFIAEELYQNLPCHLESIMLESYPLPRKDVHVGKANKEMNLLYNMIKDIRQYKSAEKLAPNIQLNYVISSKEKYFDGFEVILKRFTFANKIEFIGEKQRVNGNIFNYDNATLFIQQNINIDEEIDKLKKEIATLINEVSRGEKMLSNDHFIEKAPKDKIELEKNKLQKNKQHLDDVSNKLKELEKNKA